MFVQYIYVHPTSDVVESTKKLILHLTTNNFLTKEVLLCI